MKELLGAIIIGCFYHLVQLILGGGIIIWCINLGGI